VRFLGARLAAVAGQTPAALAELAALAQSGHDGYAVQMTIAELIDADAQPDALRAALKRAHELDPSQSEPLRGLWKLAQEQGDELEETRILSQLARIEERDVSVYRRLLELLIAQKSVSAAVEVGSAAIYVDLEGARTHALYAQALALAGRTDDASFEFESAVLCPCPVEELAAAHLDFAEFLGSHGRNARAAAERERALSLDPQRGKAVDPP
jgi:tetratricopeptide (TPR) repeat protein